MIKIYDGNKKCYQEVSDFLKENPSPSWRDKNINNGKNYIPSEEEINVINIALHLRRPILISGNPGIGKSSLAKSVAYNLDCENVLHWQITTHSVLQEGLYSYDSIGRLQDVKNEENNEIGDYIHLGTLGTAFASNKLKVILIDEIDKSDIDFPNNLLHIFEEREFLIPELARHNKSTHLVYDCNGNKIEINLTNGKLHAKGEFPLIIMTSNNEREFPPAFMRRVITHSVKLPDDPELLKEKFFEILNTHMDEKDLLPYKDKINNVTERFISRINDNKANHSVDQLMNAIFLEVNDIDTQEDILENIWHKLSQ